MDEKTIELYSLSKNIIKMESMSKDPNEIVSADIMDSVYDRLNVLLDQTIDNPLLQADVNELIDRLDKVIDAENEKLNTRAINNPVLSDDEKRSLFEEVYKNRHSMKEDELVKFRQEHGQEWKKFVSEKKAAPINDLNRTIASLYPDNPNLPQSTPPTIGTLHDTKKDYDYNFTEYKRHLGKNILGAGTNGKLEVRVFNKDSYNGPQTDDFLRRAESLHNTALSLIPPETDKTTEEQKEQNKQIKGKLEEIYEELKLNIKQQAGIDPTQINVKKGEGVEYFKEKHNVALKLLHQFNIDNIKALNEGKDYSLVKELGRLEKAETDVVATTGRSNLIHIYGVEGKPPQTRISTSETKGGYTHPSSKRDEPNLSNFLKVSSGYVEENGNAKIEFSGYRHSSYPPIKIIGNDIKTKMERREGATKSVEQMLQTIAQDMIAKDPSLLDMSKNPPSWKQPFDINLSTMMLLSPILKDQTFMGGDSEMRQVKDTLIALNIYNNQKEVPLKIKVNGIEVDITVNPKLTQMNMPSNVMLKFQSGILGGKFNDDINNKGFYEYHKNFMAFIQTEGSNPDFKKIFETNKIDAELDNLIKEKSSVITDLYAKLGALQKDPANAKEYEKTLKDIRSKEKELNKIYKEFINKQKEIWTPEKIKAARDDIEKALEKDPDNKSLQVAQLYLDSAEIYYSNAHKLPENGHQFQTRYLIANDKMGKNVEFFCKSGEDRTGRANNHIEEFLAFRKENGHFPKFGNKENLNRLEEISHDVHNGAVSKEITDQNAPGAKGLQQGSSFGSNAVLLLGEFDKMMATMAKGAYGSLPQKMKYRIQDYTKESMKNKSDNKDVITPASEEDLKKLSENIETTQQNLYKLTELTGLMESNKIENISDFSNLIKSLHDNITALEQKKFIATPEQEIQISAMLATVKDLNVIPNACQFLTQQAINSLVDISNKPVNSAEVEKTNSDISTLIDSVKKVKDIAHPNQKHLMKKFIKGSEKIMSEIKNDAEQKNKYLNEDEAFKVLRTIFKNKEPAGYAPFSPQHGKETYKLLNNISIESMVKYMEEEVPDRYDKNPYLADSIFKKRELSETIFEGRDFRKELSEKPELAKKYYEIKTKHAFELGNAKKFQKNIQKLNPDQKKYIGELAENFRKITRKFSKSSLTPTETTEPTTEITELKNESTVLLDSMLKSILKDRGSVKFAGEGDKVFSEFDGQKYDMQKILQEADFDQIKFTENDFENYMTFLTDEKTNFKPWFGQGLNAVRDVDNLSDLLEKKCQGGSMENTSKAEKLAANIYTTEACYAMNAMFRGDISCTNSYDIHIVKDLSTINLVDFKDSYIFSSNNLHYINNEGELSAPTIDNQKRENLENQVNEVINNGTSDNQKITLSCEEFNKLIIDENNNNGRLNSGNLAETMLSGAMFVHCLNSMTANKINAFRIDKALPDAKADERIKAAENQSTTVMQGITSTNIDKPDKQFFDSLSSTPNKIPGTKKIATLIMGELFNIKDVNATGAENEAVMKPNTLMKWMSVEKIGDVYYLVGLPTKKQHAPRTKSDLGFSKNNSELNDLNDLEKLAQAAKNEVSSDNISQDNNKISELSSKASDIIKETKDAIHHKEDSSKVENVTTKIHKIIDEIKSTQESMGNMENPDNNTRRLSSLRKSFSSSIRSTIESAGITLKKQEPKEDQKKEVQKATSNTEGKEMKNIAEQNPVSAEINTSSPPPMRK